jgi:hypothetical protein
MVGSLPFRLKDRKAGVFGMSACGADAHATYRQRPEMLLPPAKPHECSRITSKFTVRPEFEVTVWRRRRSGVKF